MLTTMISKNPTFVNRPQANKAFRSWKRILGRLGENKNERLLILENVICDYTVLS